PVNDAPVALDDNPAVVDEGGTAIFNLATNDTDSDNALDLNSIAITGTPPANGSLTINGDGTVTYNHDGSQTLIDSFSYTILDVSGAISNTATVNITINPVNNAPTTIGVADVTVAEDSAATRINLNAAFDDADNLDSELTYSITGNTSIGLFSSTAINAVTGELILDYAADTNGSSQMSIRATDPSGASVDTLFTITVTPVNDTPVLVANAGITALGTDNTVISNAELRVSDIDNTDTVIVYTVTALPTNGVLLVNGIPVTINSSFTEADIINNRLSYQSDGLSATDQFAFTVSDSAGGTISNNAFNIVVQFPAFDPGDAPGTIDTDVNVTPEPFVNPVTPPEINNVLGGDNSAPPVQGIDNLNTGGSTRYQTPPELTLEPVPPVISEQVDHDRFNFFDESLETNQTAEINFSGSSTVADIQMKSIKALWIAIDEMKQRIDDNVTDDMTQVEFRAAAVSSSGVALTAGVVAWVLRSGALMTSLISTIPLRKGYDPLPILAYKDDDEEENIAEDKIPTSLEEMRKIKEIKERVKKQNQVDNLFGGSGV
ncbi:MAG: hypothetical protein GQ549_06945, partial [Gammaproteobacteria bacterium]|nr:hypothetical protein [Gammaproteobacteria bacterium]